MALRDFLFRCPFCGREPLSSAGSQAGCPGCGRAFEPGAGRATIRVTEPSGRVAEFPAGALAERLSAFGGRDSRDSRDSASERSGSSRGWEARASMRSAREEISIRTGEGRLLGFAERFGPAVQGTLELSDTRLTFMEDSGTRHDWPVDEIRALQGSSSEIQVSPAAGGVVAFRLSADSPRLWEEALRERLRARWSSSGRGEIVEFQPRIRGR